MTDYQPIWNDHPVWMNGVKVNNLDFFTTGAGVLIDGIAGWQDGVEVRDVREPRPGFDGEDADTAYMAGRTITVSGRVAAASWSALQTAKQALAATFQPTAAEVLFKVPTATASAPTTSYATTGMTNYERVNAKVVEPIAFGAVEGFTQEWQVSLRASDPRIYSDVETTGDWSFDLASYVGGVPAKLVASVGTGSGTYAYATSSTGTNYARTTVPADWDTATGTYTTELDWVIDGRERESYYLLPQNFARTAMLDPVWVYWLRDAGATADNAQGTAAYDGTINGAPSTNQAGPATDMESILFDGVNDSVSRAWSADLFPAEWTFETWVKTSSSGFAVDYTGGSTTAGLKVYAATSGGTCAIYAEVGDGSSLVNVGTGYAVSTSFAHVALTYRSGVVTMYVNGSSIGRTRLTYSEPTSGTYYLGRTNAGVFWAGNISTTGVYSVAYPSSVIEDIYNGGAAQSACRYKAGTYVDVTTWPVITATTTINPVGNMSSGVSTYRTARL